MMSTLHFVALGLYGLAAVLALAPFAGLPVPSRRWSVALPGAGALAHGLGLAQLTPAGLAPILSMLALFLIVLQLCSELVLRATAVALFTAPLAAGLVGLALLLGLAPGVAPSAGQNLWFILHVTLSVLGLALLALAFVSAALYLLQFRELKAKRFGQVFQLFPPLERLDRLNHVALVAAFPALTLGVLLALGYAVRFAGGVHVEPAQVVWGTFMWAVLGAGVWGRVVRGWVGRRAAFASIAGFVAVVLVYLALKLAEPGTERFL
jgi:ABC-type uncharacterized transport system permease subunit